MTDHNAIGYYADLYGEPRPDVVKRQAKERRCTVCGARLSGYNKGTRCAQHEQVRETCFMDCAAEGRLDPECDCWLCPVADICKRVQSFDLRISFKSVRETKTLLLTAPTQGLLQKAQRQAADMRADSLKRRGRPRSG